MPKIETYRNGQLISSFDPRTLEEARNEAVVRLEEAYRKAISEGVTVEGITLGAEDGDRGAFVELLTLLREADADSSMPVVIADKAGIAHQMNVGQARTLLVLYGQAIQVLWARKASLRTEALAALTNEAADSVVW